jgi:myo-inositol-1(or 4)-monophosphatase
VTISESLPELLRAARAAARAATSLLADASAAEIRAKGSPRDLVTEWDLRAEDTIRRVLWERTPGIPILGEEGGLEQGASTMSPPLRWVVDPIDGTVNFAHGLPIWASSIGLEDTRTGEPLVGVVSAPALGWWFEALRGGGASDASGVPLRVSTTARFEEAMLGTGFPYDIATSRQDNLAEWGHLYRTAGTCRRLGSASLDLCLVARGWFDGYWERKLKPWDVAAGVLVVLEAGGSVTDTRGGPFDLHGGEVVATNGAIHERLVSELRHVSQGEVAPTAE